MSSSVLYRWAGYATVVAAIVLVIGEWLHPANVAANVGTGAWVTAHGLIFITLLLGVPGLFGLYARQSKETGALGFLGFVLAFIGMMGFTGFLFFEAFINPVLAKEAPAFVEKVLANQLTGLVTTVLLLTGLSFSLGWLLFGWATARGNVLPRIAAYLALIGGLFLGVEPLFEGIPSLGKIAATVFGIGLLWLGYALASERKMMA